MILCNIITVPNNKDNKFVVLRLMCCITLSNNYIR